MIPIHLTIQGIYSYQEKQSVDFTKLTNAHLFGIFGSVGSGKSTILEAITFALYGRTDRLNLSGDNRNYNMMNLKSNDLFIAFIFRAGYEDTEYQIIVKGKRNSKQFEEVKALDRFAYKKANADWQPIDIDSIGNIIGLSYENFKRTVIIPQGRFQEFLQLGAKERTQMMKELFHLEKFELYAQLISLETKNNEIIHNLEGQLTQLEDTNPEKLEEIEKLIHALQHEIESKMQDYAVNLERENSLSRLKLLDIKIKEHIQTLTSLKEQEPAIDELGNKLKTYKYCLLNFKSLLETLKQYSQRIQELKLSIQADDEQSVRISQQLNSFEAAYPAVKNEYDNKLAYNQQVEDFTKIIRLHELRESEKTLKDRIFKGEKIFNETQQDAQLQKQMADNLNEGLRNLRDDMPDMAALSEAYAWFTKNKVLTNNLQVITTEINSIQNELNELQHWKKQLWNTPELNIIPRDLEFKETLTLIGTESGRINQLLEQLNTDIEHYVIQARLEEHAANLEDGKPCPLCGALSHPAPMNIKDISGKLQDKRSQKTKLTQEASGLDILKMGLSQLEAKVSSILDIQEKAVQKQKDVMDQLSAHQKLFRWDACKDETTVSELFTKAEKIQAEIKEKEGELQRINSRTEAGNQNLEKYRRVLDEIRQQMITIQAEINTLINQVKSFSFKEFEDMSIAEINHLRDNILKKIQENEKTFETITTNISRLQQEKGNISGRLEVNRKSLETELLSIGKVQASIESQLKLSTFGSVAEIETILDQTIDIQKEELVMEEFRKKLDFNNQQLAGLQAEMGNQQYNATIHLEIVNNLKETEEKLSILNQSLGKCKSDLMKLKENLETKSSLSQQLQSLKSRADDLKTLKQLFKGSGFVNYVSSVYLQELCHTANERFFKLTRQTLSLEITGDNNFQVRDFLNGGKARNIKTLSGGQTFQAALCLALALADNIKRVTDSAQNFFFLDEGFGSLDKESLEIVFDTLKSLRKENRVVGVISHVEEMQQEIDTHIKITNDTERGSIIRTSWE